MRKFLASPIRVFDAINWLLLGGGMFICLLVRQWFCFVYIAAAMAAYAFVLRPQAMKDK
jgi:hypothetical protein